MITHWRIEVNPDQIRAISDLRPPRNPKEVQKLTRMTAALNRFISRLVDRCRPFFTSYITGRDSNGLKSVILPLRS